MDGLKELDIVQKFKEAGTSKSHRNKYFKFSSLFKNDDEEWGKKWWGTKR